MKYEQLPPSVRALVDAKIGRGPREARRSRSVATAGTTTRWRCAKCGTEYTTDAAINRSQCRRIEVVLAEPERGRVPRP